MAKHDRLGRGLGALLGEYLGEQGKEATSRSVPVAAIRANPFQPRRDFDEEELAELAASIRENGLLQPIVVRPLGNREGAGTWELVAGERRWRAVTLLGWKEVPALVRRVDDRTLLVLALVENLQRAGLSDLEEAEGFRELSEEFGLTQQEIAAAVGRERSTVANALRLLQLPASVRRYLEEGKLTAGHARALLGVAGERKRAELARQAVEEGWTVREVEERARRSRSGARGRKPKLKPGRDPAERELEAALQRALGTQVRIRRLKNDRGRIEIPFYGVEDFERLFELLSGESALEVAS